MTNIPETELIKKALNKCKTAFFWLVATSFVINILMLVQSIYMLQIFVRVLPSHRPETLIYLTLITILAMLTLSLLLWVRSRILSSVSLWLNTQLAPAALLRCPEQLLKGINYGTQSISDVNQVAGFITSPGMIAILDIPWIPVYIIFIFFLHPLLGVVTIIGALLITILAVMNEWITRKPFQNANRKFVRNQILLDTTLRNSEAIQAMGMMDSIIENWKKKQEEARSEIAPSQLKASYIQYTTQFIRMTLQILIYGIGAYLVIIGVLTPGAMIAASIVVSRAYAPLENGIASWQTLANARIAYRRLLVHLHNIPKIADSYMSHTPEGRIEIHELSYLPPAIPGITIKPILENISLHLEPGEMLAIIGPSGSGKTTLSRMITGVYEPTRGTCRLDGAISYLWNRRDFGKYVGYLPQTIELFDGTVAENIARMEIADKEKVIAAGVQANVHQQILRLPKGYDTDVGSYGAALSGGIRQRIALARALYGNPTLVVLDEPNSNLDDEGIAALIKTLLTLKEQKRTVIVVTHHRNLLALVDKILLLQQGKVAMFGPAGQVIEKLQSITQQMQQQASQQTSQ